VRGLRLACSFGQILHSKWPKLFDHFVSVGEQKMLGGDLDELARAKKVDFPKAIRA
jgi:hypothetical protein